MWSAVVGGGWENARVLTTYRDLLTRPGALAFSAAGAAARLPISTVGIGTILAISSTYGSYALAGQVAAVVVATQAACAPVLSRWVDRRGQAAVMGPALGLLVAGLAALTATTATHGPHWLLHLAAALVGASMGSVGAMVRARWSHLLRTPAELHSAFSWESTVDEVVFVIGPVLATALATGVTPTGGLLLAAVAAVVGGWLLLAQRGTEPPPHAAEPGTRRSGLVSAPLLVVVATFVAMGAIFGAIDVSVVAFTEELGRKSWAGAVLAVFAFGSGAAGLVYGARHWLSPVWRHFTIGMVALGVGVGLLGTVGSIGALAGVALVVGAAIAPTLVAGNGIVASLVPAGRLTEGLTWIGTALGGGVSVGAWAGGAMVDRSGSDGGFTVVMVAGAVAVLTTLAAAPVLRRASGHRVAPNTEPNP